MSDGDGRLLYPGDEVLVRATFLQFWPGEGSDRARFQIIDEHETRQPVEIICSTKSVRFAGEDDDRDE